MINQLLNLYNYRIPTPEGVHLGAFITLMVLCFIIGAVWGVACGGDEARDEERERNRLRAEALKQQESSRF